MLQRMATVLLALSLSACLIAGTTEDHFPTYEITGRNRVGNIETAVADFVDNGGKSVVSDWMGRKQSEIVVGHWIRQDLVETETFRESEAWTGDADYEVVFSGTMNLESSVFLGVLHWLTLFVLPAPLDWTIDLTVKRREVSTGRVTVARAKQREYSVSSILFFPFHRFYIAGVIQANSRLSESLYCQLWPSECTLIAPGDP